MLFFTAKLGLFHFTSDNVVGFQWLNRMLLMFHVHQRIHFSWHKKKTADEEKKLPKNRDKNWAHIIFPEKTNNETASKAKRTKLILHLLMLLLFFLHSRRSMCACVDADISSLDSFRSRSAKLVFPISEICLFSYEWRVRTSEYCASLCSCCRLHAESVFIKSVNMRTLLRYI